jgi:hypothetical protein
VVTTVRVSSVTFGITEGQAELDSHADTTVLSENTALLIHDLVILFVFMAMMSRWHSANTVRL